MAAFGVDVLDPAVTPRRIAVLAERVPPWARPFGQQWSVEAELLAVVVDHLAQLTYVTLRAAGAKSAQKPRPLPRPPRARPRPAQATSGPGAGRPRAGAQQPQGWLAAAAQLSAIPGVITSTEGGPDD